MYLDNVFSSILTEPHYITGVTVLNTIYVTIFCAGIIEMSHDMRFPTMWYVRPAKAQTSLRIRAD